MAGDTEHDVEEEFGDRTIGANVAILRGDRTQKSIADSMQSRGLKWSQTTVWEVESGKRSLKAKEAKALADVLNVPVQRLFGETGVTQTRIVIERGIRKLRTLETAAAEALEQYAFSRTQAYLLAEETLTELAESGVDHDEVLSILAKHLKRLASKSLEDVLEDRARAVKEAKKTFGDGTILRFHPGVRELVPAEDDYYGLIEMLTEVEADGEYSEEA